MLGILCFIKTTGIIHNAKMFVNQLQTLSGIKFPLYFSKEFFEVFPVSFNVILHGEI